MYTYDSYPTHKFVMVEKRHYITEYIAETLSNQAGWDNVLFMNKDVILISKSSSRQILLVGFTFKTINKTVKNFCNFGNHPDSEKLVTMIKFLDSSFSEESKTLKMKEFVNLTANTLNLYYKILPLFVERMAKYNKGLLTHNGINKFIGWHKNNFNNEVDNLRSEIDAYRERNYIC